jgi:hypothetical protein
MCLSLKERKRQKTTIRFLIQVDEEMITNNRIWKDKTQMRNNELIENYYQHLRLLI